MSQRYGQLICDEILDERAAQDAKWGEQNHSPLAYFAIFAEEAGEVAKDVVELTFARSEHKRKQHLKNMRLELVQTAAVAVAMIQALDRQEAGEAPALCPCKK